MDASSHPGAAVDEGEASRSPRGRRSLRWRGWRRPTLELAGLVVGVALFSWLHDEAGTAVAQATANAQALQSVERALRLDVEVGANHWLAGLPALTQVAVWCYRLYYVPLAAVLLWLLVRHAVAYRRVRTVLLVMAASALLVFWAFPVSPPRFAVPGIVDLVAEHDAIAGAASRDLSNGQNHFSAFPSLHVGWSALCAYAAWLALRPRHPRAALLVWLFPVVMVGVVIATGNHYVLDVGGSAALLAVSIAAAAAWDRRRHRPAPAERLD